MKKLTILLMGAALAIGTTACKKKGCTDELAENVSKEAQKDDGSCTYLSDRLVGNYSVAQSCYYDGESSYTMQVLEGSNKGVIILQNLDNSVDVQATISGAQFTFKEDKAGITYEGSGYMVGDSQITINLEICETYYYPCSDPESCTLTLTK